MCIYLHKVVFKNDCLRFECAKKRQQRTAASKKEGKHVRTGDCRIVGRNARSINSFNSECLAMTICVRFLQVRLRIRTDRSTDHEMLTSQSWKDFDFPSRFQLKVTDAINRRRVCVPCPGRVCDDCGDSRCMRGSLLCIEGQAIESHFVKPIKLNVSFGQFFFLLVFARNVRITCRVGKTFHDEKKVDILKYEIDFDMQITDRPNYRYLLGFRWRNIMAWVFR